MMQLVSFETLMEYLLFTSPALWFGISGERERLAEQSVFQLLYVGKGKGRSLLLSLYKLTMQVQQGKNCRLPQSDTCYTALCFWIRGKQEIFPTYRSI